MKYQELLASIREKLGSNQKGELSTQELMQVNDLLQTHSLSESETGMKDEIFASVYETVRRSAMWDMIQFYLDEGYEVNLSQIPPEEGRTYQLVLEKDGKIIPLRSDNELILLGSRVEYVTLMKDANGIDTSLHAIHHEEDCPFLKDVLEKKESPVSCTCPQPVYPCRCGADPVVKRYPKWWIVVCVTCSREATVGYSREEAMTAWDLRM